MSILRLCLLGLLLASTACSKPASDKNAPLAFVPVDTPFVIANVEPIPDATVESWARQMQVAWPTLIGIYERMLDSMPDTDDARSASTKRVIQAVLDEMRGRDTPARWAEVGFSMKAHGAFYGVGMIPVMRGELGDPDKFRAMIGRIETKAGTKLGTSRVDDQDVWTIDIDKVQALIAIEDKHLVMAMLPTAASNELRRRVLGLDRPAASLADTGALASFNNAEDYLPYGSGWIDFRRVAALVDNDPGYAAIARLFATDPPKLDPVCRSELEALAARAPRLVMGYTALDGQHMASRSRLDLDSELASALQKLSSPPPGSAAASTALYDISISLPILKIKDFLIERSNAIVDAPFRCPALASWNEAAAQARQQLAQIVPPPFSDMTGLRMMINRLDVPEEGTPDVSVAMLIGTSNPMGMIGMAQLAVPDLRDFKLTLDGKAVDLPAGIFPNQAGFAPAMKIAANEKALAVGLGDDIDLGGFLGDAAARKGQLLRVTFNGKFYEMISTLLTRFSAMMPEQQLGEIQQQTAMYALYARWIRSTDMRIKASDKGIEILQDVQLSR